MKRINLCYRLKLRHTFLFGGVELLKIPSLLMFLLHFYNFVKLLLYRNELYELEYGDCKGYAVFCDDAKTKLIFSCYPNGK